MVPARNSTSAFLSALDREALAEVEQDAIRFDACIDQARSLAPGEVEGFFGPGSMLWRMFGELAVNAGGFRAVAMQIAHPAVAAAGVHSERFREGFLMRSLQSFGTVSEMAFGSVALAVTAARRLHVLHALVRDTIPAEVSPRRTGEPYRANETAALFWVLATLFEASVFAHERFVGPLSQDETDRYYEDIRLLGLLHGIPLHAMPETTAGFSRYWDGMISGDQLEDGPAALGLMRSVAASTPVRTLAGRSSTRLAWLDDAWLTGTVPPQWAGRLGLEASASQLRAFHAICKASRTVLAVTPLQLRRSPAYHQGMLRVARHRRSRPAVSGLVIEWASSRVTLPFSLKEVQSLEGDAGSVLTDLFG